MSVYPSGFPHNCIYCNASILPASTSFSIASPYYGCYNCTKCPTTYRTYHSITYNIVTSWRHDDKVYLAHINLDNGTYDVLLRGEEYDSVIYSSNHLDWLFSHTIPDIVNKLDSLQVFL